MQPMIFDRPGERFSYSLTRNRHGRYVVTERDRNTTNVRGFKINHVQAAEIMEAVDGYEVAAGIYHRKRLARRERAAGGNDGQAQGS